MKKQSKRRAPIWRKHYTILNEMMASPTELLPADHRRHQLTKMYDGLAALEKSPEPKMTDWQVVSDAVNLMETLTVEMQVCEDTSGLLMDAITALAMAGRRNLAGGAIRLDGAGIQAVRAILEDYAAMLDVLPARTMIRCHRLTEQRLHEIFDGKRKPHDVLVTSM
jgi:hypothetical protein